MEQRPARQGIGANISSVREEVTPIQPDAERYEFGCRADMTPAQMLEVASINEVFARKLTASLAELLQADCSITVTSLEQIACGDLIARLGKDAYLCLLRPKKHYGTGVVALEPQLGAATIDLLLGGEGRAEERRSWTEIDDLVLLCALQVIVKELDSAWSRYELQCDVERPSERSAIVLMMPATEKMVCMQFAVKMAQVQGDIHICLPTKVLRRTSRAAPPVTGRSQRAGDELRARVREIVSQTKLSCVLQFPPLRVQASRIAALQVGSMLRLRVPRHAAAELRVGGLPFAEAQPVRIGEWRGARLAPTDWVRPSQNVLR